MKLSIFFHEIYFLVFFFAFFSCIVFCFFYLLYRLTSSRISLPRMTTAIHFNINKTRRPTPNEMNNTIHKCSNGLKRICFTVVLLYFVAAGLDGVVARSHEQQDGQQSNIRGAISAVGIKGNVNPSYELMKDIVSMQHLQQQSKVVEQHQQYNPQSTQPLRNDLYPPNTDLSKPTARVPLTAIVHVGPEKTGSTAIQSMLQHSISILENEDHYVYTANNPFVMDQLTPPHKTYMSEYADCFQLDPEHETLNGYGCNKELYDAVLQLGKYGSRPSNIIVSSERFHQVAYDLSHVYDYYTKNWDNVIIVLYYRRYFEWLISLHFQGCRLKPIPKRNSMVKHIRDEIAKGTDIYLKYTSGVMERFQEYFGNSTSTTTPYTTVRLYNAHEPKYGGDVRQSFICDAIPDAHYTCDYLMNDVIANELKQSNDTTKKNTHHSLTYENLVYYAQQYGYYDPVELLKRSSLYTDSYVEKLVRQHNEETLQRDEYGFDVLSDYTNVADHNNGAVICPTDDEYNWLHQQSLKLDEQLLPYYHHEQNGKEEINVNFPLNKQHFCQVDAEYVIKHNQVWQEYFQTLLLSKLI